MVLGFKKQFVEKILDGTKIHTIREDKNNRWKEGNKIQFATGIRTKQYKCFKKGVCTGIQQIKIEPLTETIIFLIDGKPVYFPQESERKKIAKNDGFDSIEDFWKWFDKPFNGKLIYWTGKKY